MNETNNNKYVVLFQGFDEHGYEETKCILRDNLYAVIWIYLANKETAKIYNLVEVDQDTINKKILEYEEDKKQELINEKQRKIDTLRDEIKDIMENNH